MGLPTPLRETLVRLGIPGFKVLRWEREWDLEGRPFKDPAGYPRSSVATSGTHDTEPTAQWWDEAPPEERAAVADILGRGRLDPAVPFDARVRDAVLDVLFTSGSDIVLVPIHDVFGWRERINTPALVSDDNWTWRLRAPIEDLREDPRLVERFSAIASLVRRFGRL